MALRLLESPKNDLPLLRKPSVTPITALNPADDFLSMQTKAGKLPSYLSEKPSMIGKIVGSIMQTNPVESMARESSKLDYIQKYKLKFGTDPSSQEVSSFEGFYREGKAKEPIFKQAELPLTLAAANFAAAKPLMNIPKLAAFSGIQAVNPIGKIKTEDQTAEFARDALNMLTSGGLTEGAFKLPAKVRTARSEGTLTDIAKNISAIEKGLSETVKNSPVFKNFWTTLSPRGKALQVVRAAEKDPAVGDVVRNILSRESAGRKSELLLGKKGEAKLPLPEEKPKIPFVPPVPAPTVSPLIEDPLKYKTAEDFVKAKFEKPRYGMSHRPTYEGMPPAHNLLEGDVIPRDVYDKPEHSIASGRNLKTDKSASESWKVLQEIRDNPEAEINVYRAGAKNELNPGDWVTFSKNYADISAEGGEKVHSFKVKAKDVIFAGDDINEFGYFPKSQLTSLWQQAQGQPVAEPPKTAVEQPPTNIAETSEAVYNSDGAIRAYGTPEAAKGAINDTIKEIETRGVGEDVKISEGLGEVQSEPGRAPGQAVLSEAAQRRNEIVRKLKTQGFIDYRGTVVKNHEDIANLATLFRNPKIEQFQTLYFKNNKLVAHRVISSGVTNFVNIDIRLINSISEAGKRLGADAIYFAHNHPSGNPNPSVEDVNFTKKFLSQEPFHIPLKGHIVVNGEEYSVIDIYGNSKKYSFVVPKEVFYKEAKPIKSYEDAAEAASGFIKFQKPTVLFLNSKNELIGIDVIKQFKNLSQYVKEKKNFYGAPAYVVLLPEGYSLKNLRNQLPNGLLDLLQTKSVAGKIVDIQSFAPNAGQFVKEGTKIPLGYYGVQESPAEQPWPEELPAKPPEIQPIEDRAEMEIETLNYTGGQHPLEKAMKEVGKIRVQAKGKESEEYREVPSRFRSATGKPLDKIRQELEGHGIVFESDSELRMALKDLGDKQQRFLLSSEVQAYLKSKPNIEALGKKLGKKLSPAAYKRIVYSNVGLKPSKTPFVSTREKMLKYTLKQREIAARGGFKAGRRELRTEQRAKKQERARQIEAGKRFPREQRYEIYKAARKAGLILYEKKDPITGETTQKYKNKLSPLLRFYKKASFDEIMGYIRALRGDPENPPLVFKISGDPTADAETMKLIAEASEGWEDINRFEIGSLDLPRIVEKVTGLEIFEDNILADNTYEVLKGADDARFEKQAEELQALEDATPRYSEGSKASADLMIKIEAKDPSVAKEAEFFKGKFDWLINTANENRERLGKKPIPYMENYFTHMRDWNLLTAFFKGDQKAIDNLTNEQWQALAKGQYSKISVPFNQFAQQRIGKKTKFDAIGNYKKYLETLLYEIYMSPAIKHARVFTDYALLKQPNAKIAMDNLLDELAGKPSSFDHIAIRPIVSNSVLKALNARFGANALIGNISYYIMNASNIATASGELGNYTIKGMHGFLSNSYLRQLAFKKSSLLKSRQGLFDFEISRLEAVFAGHGKDLTFWEGAKLKDKQLEYVISSINRIIEYNNVGSSWVGAYLKAIDKFKYSPEKAYKYADSVARKTQGGYRPYEMPAYMRSDIGKLASKFGTWAFNMMNYFLYDLKMANIPGNIARIITKAPKKEVQFGKFIVLAITLMFVNTVYKKMGLRKPYNPKSFVPATPLTRGRYEQPPAGRMVEDVKTLLPLEGKRKEKPSTRAKAAEELFFMLGPRYGGAQLRRLFHGDILPEQKKEKERKHLRLLSNN